MRIDFFTNRTFCEPNQKFDRTSVGWVRSEIKLSAGVTLHIYVGLLFRKKIFRTGQASPVDVLSNFLFGSQKVRFVKKSMRILYQLQMQNTYIFDNNFILTVKKSNDLNRIRLGFQMKKNTCSCNKVTTI